MGGRQADDPADRDEHGYPSVCRRSLIESEQFKEALTLNGQDVASLYLQVLELGGKSGYMKYRTVPQFPQIGDKINKAIERVATGQQSGAEAMAQAQAEAVADLKKSGVKIEAGCARRSAARRASPWLP